MYFVARHRLRERLHGELPAPLIMAAIQIPSPDLVEMAGFAGFDIVFVDAEHGPLSAQQIHDMVRAADAAGVPAMVRVPSVSPEFVARSLDSGASAIVAPHANTAGDAGALVRAGRYPPAGDRSTGLPSRAYRFALDSGRDAYIAANDGIALGVQIESVSGVENMDAIMSTPGLDFVLVGPSDLSFDRGTYQHDEDPWVRRAIRDLGEAGRRHGVAMMTRGDDPQLARDYWGYGYRVFVITLPLLLARACAESVARTRAAVTG
jgi:4-hydroxy-2-oxoheptanedioate aldolase